MCYCLLARDEGRLALLVLLVPLTRLLHVSYTPLTRLQWNSRVRLPVLALLEQKYV
jgi:hypothetical protein